MNSSNIKDIAIEAFNYLNAVINESKEDEIDSLVEKFIIDKIKECTNDIKIVSEELGVIILGTPKQTIIIDPIDGTGNLIRNIPIYSVAIALCEGCLDIATVDEISYSIVVSTFGKFEASKNDSLMKQNIGEIVSSEALIRCSRPFRMRILGASTVELCLLANGSIDGFIELKGLKLVDLLPVLLILKNKGCSFTDGNGNELKFRLCNPKENRYTIVAARSEDLLQKLLLEVRDNVYE